MIEINGHRLYDCDDIDNMLIRLDEAGKELKQKVIDYVKETETGIDRRPLLNVVTNPSDCYAEYFDRFDSDVGEKFIRIMEKFNLVY